MEDRYQRLEGLSSSSRRGHDDDDADEPEVRKNLSYPSSQFPMNIDNLHKT